MFPRPSHIAIALVTFMSFLVLFQGATSAHIISKPVCIQLAKKQSFSEYTQWKRYIQKCRAKAKKHNKWHRNKVKSWSRAKVSWYGPGFYGNHTACGQVYNSTMLIVAHKSMQCGTKLTLRYKGRSVKVTVADRGPYVHGRIFDLSAGTRSRLNFSGVQTIKWKKGW